MRSIAISLAATALVSCAPGPALPGVEELARPAIASNAIASNAIASNAIASNAIASGVLASNALARTFPQALNTGVDLQPEIVTALEDDRARIFMSYLVSCALRPDQTLIWQSRPFAADPNRPARSEAWSGSIGLCPDWLSQPPSPECLERVSSCILARNNAFGVSVPLSMRGNTGDTSVPGGKLLLDPKFPPWPKALYTNSKVRSAEECARPSAGPKRNCGWEGVGVGRCLRGEPVQVGGGAACRLAKRPMLRVCSGIRFCDAGSRDLLATSEDPCGPAPVEFRCPDDGYYTILRAEFDSRLATKLQPVVQPARFPSCEADLFRWREGAFYGNLFGPGALNPHKPQLRINPDTAVLQEQDPSGPEGWSAGTEHTDQFTEVVFPNMWACWSRNWTTPDAYFNRRVCAGPDPATGIYRDPDATTLKYNRDCVATPVGPCEDVQNPRTGVCQVDNRPPAGSYDFGVCGDRNRLVWTNPITTLLNSPCALLPPAEQGACTTVSPIPLPDPAAH